MRTLARSSRLIWRVLFCAALIELVPAPMPAAAATCTFDSTTATVSVSLGSGTGRISLGGGGAILLAGAQCGAATIDNTDTVHAAGSVDSHFTIDLSGGAFVPGATAETKGQSEIEFSVNLGSGTSTLEIDGSSGADRLAVGADGVNLNAGESVDDVDVTLKDVTAIVIVAGDGNDAVGSDGGQGTGGISTTHATIDAGAGNDRLAGSSTTDTLDGGAGTDTVDYSAATTSVFIPTLPNTTITSTIGSDVLRAIENVDGSPAGDSVYGGSGRNVLRGGGGPDTFGGGGGDDVFVGGPGDDRADYSHAGTRVVVNLARGTARGQGHDRLRSIEWADGGRFSDTIVGTRGANWVRGGAGSDSIKVGAGDDEVDASDGNDSIDGGPGDDVLYGEAGSDTINGGLGYDTCPDTSGQNRVRGCEAV